MAERPQEMRAAASGLVSASSCASTALSSHHDSGVQQKIKLRLCYGGRFEQTANNSYKFVGGEYFNESIPYGIRYADFMFKLSEKFRTAVSVKYHAPGEELVPDQLISVQDDADLQELIEDYLAHLARPGTPCKTFRIKVFVFMAAEEPLTPDEIMEGQHFFGGADSQMPARLNAMRLLDGRSSFGSTLSSVGTPSTRQQDLSAADWPVNSAGQGLGLGLDEMEAAAAAGLLNEAELQEHMRSADHPALRARQQAVRRLTNLIAHGHPGAHGDAAPGAAADAEQQLLQQLLPSAADLGEDGVVVTDSEFDEQAEAVAAAEANNSMLRQISQEMDEVLQAIDAAAAHDTCTAAGTMREILELDPPPLFTVRETALRRQLQEADDGYDGEDYKDWEAAEAAGQERESDYQSDAPTSHTPYTDVWDGDEDVTSGRQTQQRSDSMDSMVRALPTHISDFGESAPGDEEDQQALLVEAALGATAGAAGRTASPAAAGQQHPEAAAAGAEDGTGGALHLPSHISAFGDDLGPLPGVRAMLSGSAEPEDGFAADLAPRLSGGQLGYARPRTQDSSFSLDGGAIEGEGQGPDAAGGITAERAGSGDSLTSLPKLQPVHRLAKPDLKIVQRIGEGAFGEVSVAKAPLYGTVAVKWLKSERFSKHFASFGREAALLADLNHPNVLRFYGVVTESAADNTVIGIMTEYIRGGSMSSFLRMSRTLLPLRVRCELALGAANGLAYLHELRIVHFDLKPDNLLLDAPPGVVRAAAESGSEELPPPRFVTSPRALTSPGDSSSRGVGGPAAAAGSNASSQEPGLARGGSGLGGGTTGSNTSPGAALGPRAAGGGSGTCRNSSGPGVTRSGSGLMESSELPVVKVADFGLSKHKLNSSYVSSCRDLRGTLPYMAPELVSDPERVCEKADVWSLGVVMWEMMTRETPFQDLPPQQILLGLMCGNLHLDVPEWCEPEWRFLLEACMEANPNNRPTMRELARQLEAIRDQQLQHEQELEELEAKRLQQLQPPQQQQAQGQAADEPQPSQLQAAEPQQQQQQVQDTVRAAPTPGVLLQHNSQAGRQLPSLQAPQQAQLGHSQGLPPLHSAQQQQQHRLVQPPPQLEVQSTVPHLQPLQQQPVLSPVQLPDDLLDLSDGGTGGAGAYGAVCEAYWPQHSPLAPAAVTSPGRVGPIGPAHPQLQQL